MEGLLATGPGRYQIRIAAGEAELAAQLLLLARIAQTGGQRQRIDWLVVDLTVLRSGMRLRRIARIVVRLADEEMLRVVGASVVAKVVRAADPVQLLVMSQPLQIMRNLVRSKEQ